MQHAESSSAAPCLKQLTPVIIVDAVEPCLPFWTGRLGFTIDAEVPGPDGALQFAILSRDGIEVMYQTRASVIADHPGTEDELNGQSVGLFITVDDLDAVERALDGAPVVKPRHQTFYGSSEIYVREPGGNTVGFAQMGARRNGAIARGCGRNSVQVVRLPPAEQLSCRNNRGKPHEQM